MNGGVNPSSSVPAHSNGLGPAPGRIDDTLQALVDSLLSGLDVDQAQALQDLWSRGMLDVPELDFGKLFELIQQLPPGHQRQLLDSGEMLPPALRDALERLDMAQPALNGLEDRAGEGVFRAESTPAGLGTARGETAFGANATPPGFAGGNAASAAALAAPAGNQAAQPAATPASAFAAQAERATLGQPLPQAGRVGDAAVGVRLEAPNAAVNPDRPHPAQPPPLTAQAVLAPQGRTDALAAQLLPQAASATVLAAPQGAVMTPQGAAPVAHQGAENAAAQARDSQLAPGGHTLAGSLRRDLRRGVQPGQQRADWVMALLPGRRKRAQEGEEEATSFQWLFWVLTIAAYGALAVAVIAMIPSGGSLTDGFGRPSYGAYALGIGAIAAVASWWVGKRLAKR